MLEISLWTMFHSQSGRPAEVDSKQIETLIENNQCSTTWEIADITQNIQINKVIGEHEKCVFYFTEKNRWSFCTLLLTQLYSVERVCI